MLMKLKIVRGIKHETRHSKSSALESSRDTCIKNCKYRDSELSLCKHAERLLVDFFRRSFGLIEPRTSCLKLKFEYRGDVDRTSEESRWFQSRSGRRPRRTPSRTCGARWRPRRGGSTGSCTARGSGASSCRRATMRSFSSEASWDHQGSLSTSRLPITSAGFWTKRRLSARPSCSEYRTRCPFSTAQPRPPM